MTVLVAQAMIALAIITGFTVSAEAQPVAQGQSSISITSTASAIGVLR